MRYIRVHWNHSHPEEPIEIFSENNDEGWETRKVEVFADGSISYADGSEATDSTVLAEVPLPPLQEIAADPAFVPAEITREEFEAVWQQARARNEQARVTRKKRRDDTPMAS